MKKAKLILSIIATALGGIVFFQSCTVSALEDLEGGGATDSGYGLLLAVLMLAAGIIGICTRKKSRWLCLMIAVCYGIAGRIGLEGAAVFEDLEIWSGLCFAFAAAFAIMFFIEVSVPKDTTPKADK